MPPFLYHDVIADMAHWHVIKCVSGCFGDVKTEGASLSTPSFIIFSPFYKLNKEKGR